MHCVLESYLDVTVSAARINSLIGSKHHPGEKKIGDPNICFPVFFELIFVLSGSLRNCPKSSEETVL